MNKASILEQLKYETSRELGYINSDLLNANYEFSEEIGFPSQGGQANTPQSQYAQYLNNAKFEIANELSIPLNKGYNGDITSRDAGRIGGRLGGKIGGNMVKKMISYAEDNMK